MQETIQTFEAEEQNRVENKDQEKVEMGKGNSETNGMKKKNNSKKQPTTSLAEGCKGQKTHPKLKIKLKTNINQIQLTQPKAQVKFKGLGGIMETTKTQVAIHS